MDSDTSSHNNNSENGLETDRLATIRDDIDKIDEKILALLNQRANLCKIVGQIKSASKGIVFRPFREKEVLNRMVKKNPGLLPEDHLRAIYREILSSSRRLQQPQEVVYLGPEGTFSYFAGIEYLGHSTDFKPCDDLKEVFHAVATNSAGLGIIPLENSLQGSVGQSLDLFMKYNVYIQAEIFSKISHALVSTEKSLSRVRTVYSHPQALQQCAGWLRSNLPRTRIVPMESTSAAARKVAEEQECAAVAHIKLGDILHLNILSRNIEDLPDNWTRFMVIGSSPPVGGNRDKTSLVFTLPDKPGTLVKVLTLLAQKGINMKKLESRPLRSEKWQYVFFADVECDMAEEQYRGLKEELAHACHSLRILGSYPAGPYLTGV